MLPIIQGLQKIFPFYFLKIIRKATNLKKRIFYKNNYLSLLLIFRLFRPGKECCRDDVAIGLEDEIVQLRKTKTSLESKINQAKYNMHISLFTGVMVGGSNTHSYLLIHFHIPCFYYKKYMSPEGSTMKTK